MDSLSKPAFAPYLDTLDALGDAVVAVGEWERPGIATVIAPRARQAAAAERLARYAAASNNAQVLQSGPRQWLVIHERPDRAWIDDLAAELAASAEVFDQSSGFGLLMLGGGQALTLLQKGIFVDLERILDANGKSLGSVIAYISVVVWRLSPELFGVAVPRSYAGSFWHWLEAVACAEAFRLGRAN